MRRLDLAATINRIDLPDEIWGWLDVLGEADLRLLQHLTGELDRVRILRDLARDIRVGHGIEARIVRRLGISVPGRKSAVIQD